MSYVNTNVKNNKNDNMIKKITLLIWTLLVIQLHINAQNWTQLGEDIDGEFQTNYSGWSLCLNSDGSKVAIGAYGNNENGSFSGHVRIFENVSGTWTQIGNDIDGLIEDERLGYSVSLSSNGSIVAIGAPYNNENGDYSGVVRIYQYNNNWELYGNEIEGISSNGYFGYSVSLSSDGQILAIGSPYNNYNGENSGLVRVYQYSDENWSQIGTDLIGVSERDNFGYSVSLNSLGTVLGIGAKCSNNYKGEVKIYENIGGSWQQVGENIIGQSGEFTGHSISLSSDGNIIAIGGPGLTYSDFGVARVFSYTDNMWTQIGNDIIGEEASDKFGSSVSINSDGTVLAIGAYENDGNGSNSGHTRIFYLDNNSWIQVGNDIDGENSDDNSGCSVDLNSNGSIVAIGAYRNDGGWASTGHVRVFFNGELRMDDKIFPKISVYPNPTFEKLYFEFTDNYIKKLIITDITGKQLIEKKQIKQNETISLSGFENGIYIIKIQTDEEIFTIKIIKR